MGFRAPLWGLKASIRVSLRVDLRAMGLKVGPWVHKVESHAQRLRNPLNQEYIP